MDLNKTQRAWASELAILLANIPEGVGLVIRPGRADIVPAGFEQRALMDDLHYAARLIERESVLKMPLDSCTVPISEAI